MSKSRNFLERYRLWALIDEIITSDPDQTPIQNRTIDWLVDSYLSRFRKKDEFRRIIFNTDVDPDVDETGETSKLRFLRHVPRAEIVGLFAAHSEWILAQHLSSSSSAVRKLHIPSWIVFCRKVKAARKSAKSNDVRWGLPFGVDSDLDDDNDDDGDLNLSQFGQTPGFWRKEMRNAIARKRNVTPQRSKVPKHVCPTSF